MQSGLGNFGSGSASTQDDAFGMNRDYLVAIDVVSARKAYKSNLLGCGVPVDRLSTFERKTTEVDFTARQNSVMKNGPDWAGIAKKSFLGG